MAVATKININRIRVLFCIFYLYLLYINNCTDVLEIDLCYQAYICIKIYIIIDSLQY